MGRNYGRKKFYETKTGQMVIGVALLLVLVGSYNYGLFDNLMSSTPLAPPTTDVGQGDEVYFKISVKKDLGSYAAGTSIDVYIYDADGNYMMSATSDGTTGVATFNVATVKEGSHVWLQARQAAPTSADPYITPLTEFVVGFGDPTDTVSIRNVETGESTLWVRDVTGTAPTMSLYDDAGNNITAGAHNLTTSDTQWKIDLYLSIDDVGYGAADFTDMITGDEYIGGIWVVWKGTVTQQFEQGNADEFYSWSDPTNVYYAWHFDEQLWTDSLRTGDVDDFANVFKLSGTNTFNADTASIDVFDLYKNSGSMNINNFIDGGSVGITAATVYIV